MWTLAFLGLWAGAGAGAGLASTPAEVGDRVETLLSGYEHVPSDEDWAKAGPTHLVVARLMALADDDDAGFRRARAMSSLGRFPSPVVEAFLGARARSEATPSAMRGKAAIAWVGVARERAAGEVARLLAHPDARLREDAVRALRRLAAPEVEAFLRRRASDEPVPHVQAAMRAGADRVRERRVALEAAGAPAPSARMPFALPRVSAP